MRSASFYWLLRLLVLPLWALLVGFTPGRWYCADGRPCEVATVAACCCGCTEAGRLPIHICEGGGDRPHLTAGDCGCYRQSVHADALAGRLALLDDVAPPAHLSTWERPAPLAVVGRAVAPTAHGPPRYRSCPADPRGPPNA